MGFVPTLSPVSVGQQATSTVFNAIKTAYDWLATGRPAVVLTNVSPQGYSTGTLAAASFDTEAVDTDSMHANSPNPTRITANTPGWYDINAMGQFDPNATGSRFVSLTINSGPSDIARVEVGADPASGRGTGVVTQALLYLNVGDYVEATFWQNSGSGLNLSRQRLSAQWVHS